MAIPVQCAACGRRFQAADRWAGKRAKCPHCSAEISVPAQAPQTAQPAPDQQSPPPAGAAARSKQEEAVWYVQTSDGTEHGPMTRRQVERLVSSGRLDSFCRLRHQTWSKWKWAEDLFPQLAPPEGAAATGERGTEAAVEPPRAIPAGPSTAPQPRVVVCPDCGKPVSTRASQCPHCGCPAAALDEGAAARAAASGVNATPTGDRTSAAGLAGEMGPEAKPGLFGSPWGIASVVGSAAVLLVIAVAGLGAGWWLWKSHHALTEAQDQAEALIEQLSPVEPAPAPPPVSDDEIEAAIERAAAEAAKRLDGEFHTLHSAKTLIDQTQASVDLIQALAQGDLDAIPDTVPPEPGTKTAAPYQSLYDSLYGECLAYLRETVPRQEFSQQAVSDAARRWEEQKRSVLDKEVTEELEKHVGHNRPGASESK